MAIRKLYRRVLRPSDAEVIDVGDAEACLETARALQPDLIVLDLMLPGRDGDAVLPEVRALCPDAHIVVVSGAVTEAVAARVLGLGADGCVAKVPFASQLPALVESVGR